jgi:uncharacterized protein YcaQ
LRPPRCRKAIQRLGFVQADPIRAPARAQDLTLRHRVAGLPRRRPGAPLPKLPIEEDFFVNYGFLPRATAALMHPRARARCGRQARWKPGARGAGLRARARRGAPARGGRAFDHGKTRNWFGGNSNASTQLLDGMHYRGLLRIARREGGVRAVRRA